MTQEQLYKEFDNFFSEFNLQSVEVVDPTNFAQCFDLVVAWCWYIDLPLSIFSGLLNAFQIWTPSTAVAKANFNFIPNGPTNIPSKGSIVVWSKAYNGTAGHTGVATGKGDANTFECFEQNDPTGTVSHLKTYNYNAVLGWLEFKVTNSPPPMDNEAKMRLRAKYSVDSILVELRDKKLKDKAGQIYVTDAASEKWLDTDSDPKFLGLMKRIIRDYQELQATPVGCSPAELAKAKESGRLIGRKEIKDIVSKLA